MSLVEAPKVERWKPIVKQIAQTDAMQALKERHLGDFHHVYDALLRVAGICKRNVDYEMLNMYLKDPQRMIRELGPLGR